jgi:hypothetical protein
MPSKFHAFSAKNTSSAKDNIFLTNETKNTNLPSYLCRPIFDNAWTEIQS